MTPVVLVDMDGPLADFDRQVWDTATFAFGDDAFGPIRHYEDTTERYITDHMLPERAKKMRAEIEAPGWFRSLPVVDGAAEGLALLGEWADVWICTKPLATSPTCASEKLAWTQHHFGPYWRDRTIIAPDKSLVTGHILLDDAPKPVWYERASWVPVIYPMPWNETMFEGAARWNWHGDHDQLKQLCEGTTP